MLKLPRLHRRLLYDARLQPKTVKTVAEQAKCGLSQFPAQMSDGGPHDLSAVDWPTRFSSQASFAVLWRKLWLN